MKRWSRVPSVFSAGPGTACVLSTDWLNKGGLQNSLERLSLDSCPSNASSKPESSGTRKATSLLAAGAEGTEARASMACPK